MCSRRRSIRSNFASGLQGWFMKEVKDKGKGSFKKLALTLDREGTGGQIHGCLWYSPAWTYRQNMNHTSWTLLVSAPGGSKEVDDCRVCPGHWFRHTLVGQLSSSIEVKHLEADWTDEGSRMNGEEIQPSSIPSIHPIFNQSIHPSLIIQPSINSTFKHPSFHN